MAISKFTKGSGCFICRECKKNTRDVDGNGNCRMCKVCMRRSNAENTLSDRSRHPDAFGGVFDACTTVAEIDNLLTALLEQYKI